MWLFLSDGGSGPGWCCSPSVSRSPASPGPQGCDRSCRRAAGSWCLRCRTLQARRGDEFGHGHHRSARSLRQTTGLPPGPTGVVLLGRRRGHRRGHLAVRPGRADRAARALFTCSSQGSPDAEPDLQGAAGLDRLEDVVGRHLVRFGTKDELVVQWQRSDGSPGSRQEADRVTFADCSAAAQSGSVSMSNNGSVVAQTPSGRAGCRERRHASAMVVSPPSGSATRPRIRASSSSCVLGRLRMRSAVSSRGNGVSHDGDAADQQRVGRAGTAATTAAGCSAAA